LNLVVLEVAWIFGARLEVEKSRNVRSGFFFPPETKWLKQAAHIAKLGHYVWDVQADKCLYCSPEHATIHGLSVEEYMARATTISGLAHPEDLGKVQNAFQRLREGVDFDLEYRIVQPGGEIRTVHEIGHPIFDSKGRVVQEIGTCQDITSIRETQQKLDFVRQSLTDGIEALPVGFAIYDKMGRLQIFNKNYRKFLPKSGFLLEQGLNVEKLLRHSSASVAPALGYSDVEQYMRERLASIKVADPNRKWTYKQSIGRWVTLSEHLTKDGGFIAIIEDITEEFQRQEQLTQDQKLRALGHLSGGIAHDFNNLLAVIQGSAEMLDLAPEKASSFRAEILGAAERGKELTQRLLAFSRQQTLNPGVISPSNLIRGVVSVLERTLGEAIQLSFNEVKEVWPISADSNQFENALLNLAINSRDAMPKGGKLVIEARNVTFDNGMPFPGDYVCISVSDDGCGMSHSEQEQAFEPFFTTKEVGKGNGLGLSMVYGFIQQSGGWVRLTSAKNEGTEVSIYFPRCSGDKKPAEQLILQEMPHGNGEKILVVEDDPHLIALTEIMLQRLGYKCITACDAKNAHLAVEKNNDISLILSDVVLPGGTSGPRFISELKGQKIEPKVLFMSGYSGENFDLNEMQELVESYLSKPFHLRDLATAVKAALG
jgi:PAS domain S-box-containing protein